MIAYASRTGTRRNLDALRQAGWRLMVSAKGVHRHEGFKYALDNGAWHSFQNKLPFDAKAFLEAYSKLGEGADFVVLPDIVAGGERSLDYSLEWREYLGTPICPQLLAVQDGMIPSRLWPLLGRQLGIFLGGTTEWKEGTMIEWGKTAKLTRSYFHVGRVNTVRRIRLCHAVRADSFDGSSVSRYVVTLPALERARQQGGFQWV